MNTGGEIFEALLSLIGVWMELETRRRQCNVIPAWTKKMFFFKIKFIFANNLIDTSAIKVTFNTNCDIPRI